MTNRANQTAGLGCLAVLALLAALTSTPTGGIRYEQSVSEDEARTTTCSVYGMRQEIQILPQAYLCTLWQCQSDCGRVAYTTQQTEECIMPRLTQGEIGNVSCPTNSQTKTVDGAQHVMARAFPMVVLPEGKNDQAAFGKALQTWLGRASKIADGETIEVVNEKGEVIATAVPTDDVPAREPTKEVQKSTRDGKEVEVTIVDHGLNFPKSLPIDYADLVTAINQGIRAAVYKAGLAKITEEFRQEGGLKGKRAAEPDFSKLG